MRLEVTVVAEARADFEIGFGLAERVNFEIDAGHELSSRGLKTGEEFTVWSRVRALASGEGRRLRRFDLSRGPFKGGDAETAWQVAALWALEGSHNGGSTILLVRDTDNVSERADGLRCEVERLQQSGVAILLALAHPNREAWVLHGFEPRNAHEEKLLKSQRARLRFDPRTESHRLTAKGRTGRLNAKVAVDALTSGERDREDACWQETSLATLKQRGKRTGLSTFLETVERWLRGIAEP